MQQWAQEELVEAVEDQLAKVVVHGLVAVDLRALQQLLRLLPHIGGQRAVAQHGRRRRRLAVLEKLPVARLVRMLADAAVDGRRRRLQSCRMSHLAGCIIVCLGKYMKDYEGQRTYLRNGLHKGSDHGVVND